MITLVPQCEPEPPSKPVKSNCPDCDAELAVLRITPGKSGAEYWTMRCTRCGGIHLDIVEETAPAAAPQDSGNVLA
jgi:uncharacterized Zn finger protein